MKQIAILCAALAPSSPASAHDKWANGEAVPGWVKSWCCDKTDVHHIPPSAISIQPDDYHIEGLTVIVPIKDAIPSPDGQYWGFWNPIMEPSPHIYCFFAPDNGS